MKKNQIKIGRHYTAMVSHRMATVRIDAVNPNGGWDAKNITTGKAVRILTADRLRHETQGPAPKAAVPATGSTSTKAATGGTKTRKAATSTRKAATSVNAASRPRGKRRASTTATKQASGLDAAVAVLAESGKPMTTKEIVDRMLATGLWTSKGKTPAATIYSAIIREISLKGKASRFRKTGPGRFALTAAGK